MRRTPTISTRTDTLFPYTTLFRSEVFSKISAIDRPLSRGTSVPAYLAALRSAESLRRCCHSSGVKSSSFKKLRLRRLNTTAPLRCPLARSGRSCSAGRHGRSEEHTSELQSLMRISYAVFCLKKQTKNKYIRREYNTQ